ncbi:YciI family protein [Candidatus Leptofilum sp.]|uniref:YciI family protein n=1 Tax=Candidatus Leptofilum sp. TaxID=3241576 RepID=UPI003B5CA2BE
MRYLLLIYTNEQQDAQRNEEQQQANMGAYFNFTNEVREAGVMLGGEALHPTTAATTVRVRNGQTTSTDGPFAETKEQLGGYYLLDCENLDEAIKWAAKIPGARDGSIEIRPLWEFEG